MHRRRFRRTVGAGRRKPKWQWIRFNATATTLASPFALDLLANYRTMFGITLLPADFVLWRLIIKVAVRATVSVNQANTGILFSVFNEDSTVAPTNALLAPYDERYLMWDYMYAAKQVQDSGVLTNPTFYEQYDIRSHRKLQNQNETFWAQLVQQGGITTMDTASFTYSLLTRLP